MSFSQSVFTIEVNGVPTAAFEAKRHSEADAICQSWVEHNRQNLLAKGRHGSELPPLVKLRLSRSDEQARFALGTASGEDVHEGTKIVLFVNFDGFRSEIDRD